MINGKLPNFLERDQATFYFSSISQYSNSPQFSFTSSNISVQRLRDILFFVPTAIKSERVGRPVLLTDVACSPLYPSEQCVKSYAGARCHCHFFSVS